VWEFDDGRKGKWKTQRAEVDKGRYWEREKGRTITEEVWEKKKRKKGRKIERKCENVRNGQREKEKQSVD
jgi:hypothetical protein